MFGVFCFCFVVLFFCPFPCLSFRDSIYKYIRLLEIVPEITVALLFSFCFNFLWFLLVSKAMPLISFIFYYTMFNLLLTPSNFISYMVIVTSILCLYYFSYLWLTFWELYETHLKFNWMAFCIELCNLPIIIEHFHSRLKWNPIYICSPSRHFPTLSGPSCKKHTKLLFVSLDLLHADISYV